MNLLRRLALDRSPAVTRLSRLAPLDPVAAARVNAALDGVRVVRARAELLVEGKEIAAPRLIASGWAARVRVLPDGRRQFLSFLLPGDLIGQCAHPRPIAVSSVVALTELGHCLAPPAEGSPALAQAYALSGALEEAYLLANIVRLGRLNALERIGDLLLELHERLSLAGLVEGDAFDLPLTQEALSDALGLTPVHVNRMVQVLRRDGEVRWNGRRVVVAQPDALARRLGRTPTRVSAHLG